MKKRITLLLPGIFIFLSPFCKAQQFWIENWTGTTCARYCHTYTGPNGTWTIDSTTNGAKSNDWYFSYTEQGMGRGQCGSGTGTHATAHVGNVMGSPASGLFCPNGDCGAAYDATNASIITNKRIISPVINCTGESNVTLSFNYIQQGEAGHDNDTVDFFDGTSWSYLAATPATANSSCSPQGTWTYYYVPLPASANNNANVQIGFKWTNDGDGLGSDPSFSVDSIVLSGTSGVTAPVTAFTVNDTSVCVGDTLQFTDLSTNSPTSWAWTFTGGIPPASSRQNPMVVYSTPGYYSVKLKTSNSGGSDSVTQTSYIQVVPGPSPAFTGKDSICSGDSTTITVSGGTSYLWATGATTASITITPTVTTCYSVSVSNGVCSKDTCYSVNVVPLPNVSLNITLNGTPQDTICEISQVYILGGGTPAGGAYTGPNIIGGNHIIPDTSGKYVITYTDTNRFGCKASAIDTLYVIVCTGNQNISDSKNLNLYPNPVTNTINLYFSRDMSGNMEIEIADIAGRQMSNRIINSFTGKSIVIGVSDLTRGMYFIKVSTTESVYFAKFIKQ